MDGHKLVQGAAGEEEKGTNAESESESEPHS